MITPTTRARRLGSRGFSTVELMAVVAMVGILAVLAVVSYRKYLGAAQSNEVHNLMHGIAGAQENYFQQAEGYLDCSSNLNDYYPAPPDLKKRPFNNPGHMDYACWHMLQFDSHAPTRMGFAVVAGTNMDTPPQPNLDNAISWPTPSRPWWVLQAAGDTDGDGTRSHFVTSSFEPGRTWESNPNE